MFHLSKCVVIVLLVYHIDPTASFSFLKKDCIPFNFGQDSIVCVCNSSYCDTQPAFTKLTFGKYLHIVSSQNGKRFETEEKLINQHSDKYKGNKRILERPSAILNRASKSIQRWLNAFSSSIHSLKKLIEVSAVNRTTELMQLTINRSITYQHIIGFGGAFTDAAGINIASLSAPLRKTIVKAYYGKGGLEYNLGRVPMAGTDFSTRPYSYDEVANDTFLNHFSLTNEDYSYKIPFIAAALKLNPKIKLIASPWSAPRWMKTNNELFGQGLLKKENYQIWASYFVKFLDEYLQSNISFWAITTQNEPFDGLIPGFSFNCMGWTAEQQRDWIKNNLGPSLLLSNHSQVKIIMLDDQRTFLLPWANIILSDEDAAKYVAGMGLHWYTDDYFPAFVLDMTHRKFPDHFLIGTEACTGSSFFEEAVLLGNWVRAERYAKSIIQDLNHFVTGWMDWNLLLNMQGGPNWAGNFVDSPIIVDDELDFAYKQPMYYALGHFSKYIPEGSIRIDHQTKGYKGLEVLTCLRPDGYVTVIILNRMAHTIPVIVNDSQGTKIEIIVQERSLHTFIY